MTKPSDSFLRNAAGLTFGTLVCGVVAFLSLLHPLLKAWQARSWPVVPCVITESRFRQGREIDGRRQESPELRYRYDVDGKPREGSRIHCGLLNDVGGDFVRSFPYGFKTVCRVNPRDPEDSVLIPEVRSRVLWLTGILFTLMAAFLLLLSIGSWRRYRSSLRNMP